MANKKITDLPAATTVNDSDVIEKVTLPGSTNASEQATLLQLKSYVAPPEGAPFDDFATEFFDSYAIGALTAPSLGSGWTQAGVASGASIAAATMADGRAQQRLILNNGYYGRKMPWGALWNRVKIVLAVRINNGANIVNTNGYIGVCSGTTNMVNAATCANFVGVRWGDGTGTSTFTAGTKINYFDVPSFRGVTVRTGPVITDRGGLSSGHSISADAGYLSFVIVDMARVVFANDATLVAYSVGEASCNNTVVQFSHTKDICRVIAQGDLNNTLASSASDNAYVGAAGVTAAPFNFDQSTGVLDTVNFYWPQAINLEIAALAIRKIH